MTRVGSKLDGKRRANPGARHAISIGCQLWGPKPLTGSSKRGRPGRGRLVWCARVDMNRQILDAAIRCLNWCMWISLPAGRRAWGRALIAEQRHITNDRERLAWSMGGVLMSAREFFRNLFNGG